MQTWQLDASAMDGKLSLSSAALLIESACSANPATRWLQFINDVAPVDYLSVVEYIPQKSQGGEVAPELVQGLASEGIPNLLPEFFALYRERFWWADEATRLARSLRYGDPTISALRIRPVDIPLPAWRREIYDRMNLEERLTFLYSPLSGSTFAINIYRTGRQGPFRPAEVVDLLHVAPLLQFAHRAILGSAVPVVTSLDERLAHAEQSLRRHLPELSGRELTVCAHIACGITLDGIAAELNVSPSTIATMRKRAYSKLANRGLDAGRAQLARLGGITTSASLEGDVHAFPAVRTVSAPTRREPTRETPADQTLGQRYRDRIRV